MSNKRNIPINTQWIDVSKCDVKLESTEDNNIKTGENYSLKINGLTEAELKICAIHWSINRPGRGEILVEFANDSRLDFDNVNIKKVFEEKDDPNQHINIKGKEYEIESNNIGKNTKFYLYNSEKREKFPISSLEVEIGGASTITELNVLIL